jgi:tRNA uridine 5-carboxymethylaminomethyl modification enzyme
MQREAREVEKIKQYQKLIIPNTLDYTAIPGLSNELQQKLSKHGPATIAQASLIPGITPAAISLLIFKIREQFETKNKHVVHDYNN